MPENKVRMVYKAPSMPPLYKQVGIGKAIKGNLYGRQEVIYECEDCGDCPYAGQRKKSDGNRNIQAEGSFGIMKQDRRCKRIVRRDIDFVKLELYLVSSGHNLCNTITKPTASKTLPELENAVH